MVATRGKVKRAHRKAKFTLPIAVVAGFIPTVYGVWNRRSSMANVSAYLQSSWTGTNPVDFSFSFSNLKTGLLPALAGFGVHLLASKVGINRALGRAGIPFFRV